MKYAKLLCFVALAALATMAVVASAASASATLCTKDTGHQDTAICGEGEKHGRHVKIGTKLSASLVAGTTAELTVTNSSGGTVRVVTCKTSTAGGEVTSTSGGGNITSLTFGSCESSGCTNVSAKTPATGKTSTWPSTGTATGGGSGVLHTEKASGTFTATCLFITATCEYEAATATTELKGTESTKATAQLVANSVPLAKIAGAESICGTKADWKASYSITTPDSLTIL